MAKTITQWLVEPLDDWTNQKVATFLIESQGNEDMVISDSGLNFFTMLENQLESIPNVQRWAGLVDIHVAAGSQVLQTFLDINGSSGSLLEEVPLYTNMDGAIGIFASRHNSIKSIRLAVLTESDLVNKYDLGFKLPQ